MFLKLIKLINLYDLSLFNTVSINTVSSLKELFEFYSKVPNFLHSWKSLIKVITFNNNILPTTNIIILLSFIFLLFLIFLFIKNYFIKKIIFSMLINKVASLLILILINFTLFNFLCNFNSSVILYQSFIFFIIFILLLSLYSCSGNHIYNSQEFIILSFIILFLSLILVASANDDFALFLICLEGFSLTLYIMTTLNKTFGSISAAIKYFTFGTLGSIIMFWGAVNIYEITKSLRATVIVEYINTLNSTFYLSNNNELLLNKMNWSFILIVMGFLIKLGAAPIYQWVPDVYTGVSFQVTAFFSILVKFILFILFFEWMYFFNTLQEIEYSAILSVIVGCFGTLRQTEIKRFLAYSSITHTGYLLLGDLSSVYIYLLSYIVASLALFLVLLNVQLNKKEIIYLSNLKDLGNGFHYWERFILIISLSSMAGIPPFAGFYGKMFIWISLIEDIYLYNDLYSFILLVISLLTTLIIIFYYFRVISLIYVSNEDELLDEYAIVTEINTKGLVFIRLVLVLIIIFWTFLVPIFLSIIVLIC